MSLNYNSALLRTLKDPLLEAIKSVQSELQAVDAGGKSTSEINLKEIANIHGSFTMMGYPSMIRVSSDIKTALEGLISSDKSGWDKPRVAAVSKLCNDLMAQLTDHIKSLERGEKDYAVRMFSTLSSLRSMIDLPPVESKVLFDPDPLSTNDDFKDLDVVKLRELCAPKIAELSSAIDTIPTAMDQEDRQIQIRRMSDVFDWVYGLKSSRGYHAFWLVARARCAIEMLQPVADILPFRDAMRTALVELGKFSEGSRKPKVDAMQLLMSNMLEKWPDSWMSHPVLFETISLFDLEDFWRAHEEARSLQVSRSETAFVAKQDDLLENIRVIKAAWTKICAEGGDVRPFLRSLLPFLPKYEQFPNPGVHPLMESLKAIAYRFVNEKKTNVTPEIEQEIAVAILLIEETIEKKGRWTSDLEAQSELVKKRVVAACNDDVDALRQLPVVVWGANRRRQQSQEAIAKVAEQLRADLSFIEEIFDEFFRRDMHEAKSHYTTVRVKAYTAKSILEALGQHKASQIMNIVFDLSGILNRSIPPEKLVKEQATLTLAITGMSSFLVSIEKGDSDAHRSIDQVSAQLGLVSDQKDRSIDDIVSSYQPKSFTDQEEQSVLPDQQKMTSEQNRAEHAISNRSEFFDEVIDPEIADCFFEEAETVFEEISSLRTSLLSSRDSEPMLRDLRRQFHTLKGSGRTAQIWGLGELAKRIEERLNEALADKEHYTDSIDNLAAASAELFSEGVASLKAEGFYELKAEKSSRILDLIDISKGLEVSGTSTIEDVSDEHLEPEQQSEEVTSAAEPEQQSIEGSDNVAVDEIETIEAPELATAFTDNQSEPVEADHSLALLDNETVAANFEDDKHEDDSHEEMTSDTIEFNLPEAADLQSQSDTSGSDAVSSEEEVAEPEVQSEDSDDNSDALPLSDILEDLNKHLENLKTISEADHIDLRSLNWSTHTIASLSHTLGQERLRHFSKLLESKIDFCLGYDDDLISLPENEHKILEKSVFMLIEKLDLLIEDPSESLDWDIIDEAVESDVEALDIEKAISNTMVISSPEDDQLEDDMPVQQDVISVSDDKVEQEEVLVQDDAVEHAPDSVYVEVPDHDQQLSEGLIDQPVADDVVLVSDEEDTVVNDMLAEASSGISLIHQSYDDTEEKTEEEELIWDEINERMAVVVNEMAEIQKLFLRMSGKK